MDPFLWSLAALGVMNTFDALGGIFGDNDRKDALKKERKRLEKERNDKLRLMDLEFTDAEKQANKSADRSDLVSDMNERTSAYDANAQIGQLSLQQLADAYTFNYNNQQIGANKGAGLASMAASGTRTSSVGNAIDMETLQNEQQLQLAEDSTRANYDYQLEGILQALAQNRFQIQNNRTDAFDLRQAYARPDEALGTEGGSEYQKYALSRQMQNDAYNNRIQDYTDEINDLGDFWKGVGRFTKRVFGVGNSGAANNIGQAITDFGVNDYLKNTYNNFRQQRSFRAQSIAEGRYKGKFSWFK